MYFFPQKNKKGLGNRGFTLIETFVAITILIISIVGPFTLVMKALSVSKATKGQITAMYLAQEAVEYVRNIRDENILTGNNWLTDLNGRRMKSDGTTEPYPSCDCVNNSCIVNAPIRREVIICSSNCPPIKFHPISKIYGYDNGEDSVFTRIVEIEEIDLDKEVIITVTMEWQEGHNNREFIVKEHLLNWQ